MKKKKEFIMFLEISVVEHCNLNCSLCNSHAYLVNNSEYSFEQYKKDIDVISTYYHFGVVTFMGGEPLLCKNLEDYISYARERKIAEVYRILSNGILLPHTNASVFKTVDVIEISRYPQMKTSLKELNILLKELSKRYHFTYYVKDIKYFNDIDTVEIDEETAQKGYEGCKRVDYGLSMFGGYIYKCMRPKTTNLYLFDVHQIKLDRDLRDTDGVFIQDELFEEKMRNYRNSKLMLESCKYCLMGLECMQSNKSIYHFIDVASKFPHLVRLFYKYRMFYHGYKRIKKMYVYDEGAHTQVDNFIVKTHKHKINKSSSS